MVEKVTGSFREYDSFIEAHENGHLLQTSMWSGIKSRWKFHAFVLRDHDGTVSGSMGVLIRKLPVFKYSLAYAPRGPVVDAYDERRMVELLDGVQQFCRKQNCCTLICDPYLEKSKSCFPEIAEVMGFRVYESRSKFSNIQPQAVMSLEVKGQTEEAVLASFEGKTRYNINLARRRGVVVSVCDLSYLDDFYKLMIITGKRDRFKIRPKEYFEKLLSELGGYARLYMAFYMGRPIAGTIATHYGNKVFYVYGASADTYRSLMPNYLLQWEMIRWAIDLKCDIYDFGGVASDMDKSNPLYGLYRFKKGFNSELTEFVGEFRRDFKPMVYTALKYAQGCYIRTLRLYERLNGQVRDHD